MVTRETLAKEYNKESASYKAHFERSFESYKKQRSAWKEKGYLMEKEADKLEYYKQYKIIETKRISQGQREKLHNNIARSIANNDRTFSKRTYKRIADVENLTWEQINDPKIIQKLMERENIKLNVWDNSLSGQTMYTISDPRHQGMRYDAYSQRQAMYVYYKLKYGKSAADEYYGY